MNNKILLSTIAVCFLFLLAGCAKEGTPQQIGQPSSTPTITSSAVPSESAASSPSTIANGSPSAAQLKSILAKYTTKQMVSFQSFSIGHNQNAAFALAGSDVWYITASGAQKLKANIEFPEDIQRDTPLLWTVGDVKIFKCENDGGGSSSTSYAWYVKNGQPVELPCTGMSLSYSGNGQFTTIGDTFDRGFTDGLGAGHTYKIYYLYWTADGLKEYGGLKIAQQQLLKVQGAQAIIDAITESGCTVDAIYYRANNLININYHSGDKQNGNFDNVTLVYKNNAVTPELVYPGPTSSKTENFNEKKLGDFSYGGIYQAALFPKIATYPDKFPMN
jgi:hypothetical protein